jgi:hypothetical protein
MLLCGYYAAEPADRRYTCTAVPWTKAISGKEFPCLAGLFAQRRRCRVSYIALLCAFCSVLPLTKHPPPYGKIILGKRLIDSDD